MENQIAKSAIVELQQGALKFTNLQQIYVMGNALVITGAIGDGEIKTDRFKLTTIKTLLVEF